MSPRLDSLTWEARYAYGHVFLDRCGVTMNDIESTIVDWVVDQANPQQGVMYNAGTGAVLSFNNFKASFHVEHRTDPGRLGEVGPFSEEVGKLWAIIKRNLSLSEFVREGVRFRFLDPATSLDEAESKVASSPFRIQKPKGLRGELVSPSPIAVFRVDGFECRVALQAVSRATGMPVLPLLTQTPKTLAKNQREARLNLERARREYADQPSFGAELDIDVATYDPEVVDPTKSIQERHALALEILKEVQPK